MTRQGLEDLKELTETLNSQIHRDSITGPFTRCSFLITKITHHLKDFSNIIWEPSTRRATRKEIITSLKPIYRNLREIPATLFNNIDFDLSKRLIREIYLVGGREEAKTLLEKLEHSTGRKSAIAELAMDIGLFHKSLSLLKERKEKSQMSVQEVYNLSLLLYMTGNTQKALESIKELERRMGLLSYGSTLKASIYIALNELDKAKEILSSR